MQIHRDQPPSPTSTTHSREPLLKKLPAGSGIGTGTAGRRFWRGPGTHRKGSSSEDSLTYSLGSSPAGSAQEHACSGLSVVRITSNDSTGSRGSEKGLVGGRVRELKYPVGNANGVEGVHIDEKSNGGGPEPTSRVNLRRATRMANVGDIYIFHSYLYH